MDDAKLAAFDEVTSLVDTEEDEYASFRLPTSIDMVGVNHHKATDSQTQNDSSDLVSPLDNKKRKFAAHGHSASNEWRTHFDILDEFHTSKTGIQGHRLGYCKYCLEASGENPSDAQKSTIVSRRFGSSPCQPIKMQIYKRPCVFHLKSCIWAPKDVVSFFRGNKQEPVTLKKTSLSTTTSLTSATTDIRNFVVRRGLTLNEVNEFQSLCLNMIVDTHNPFTFAEEDSLKDLVDFLRPGSSKFLPNRHKVSRTLLAKAAKDAADADVTFKKNAESRGYLQSMAIDGWMDIAKIHVEGILILLGRESYMEESEISGADHHGIAVARMIESLYIARPQVWSIVTDEAGQVSRAKRIIRLRRPHWLLMKCWAHQTNLMVKALLNVKFFSDVTSKASKIAVKINTSSNKWAVKLYNTIDDVYEKTSTLKILNIGATRWNSAQAMFASQLRVKTACRVFYTVYNEEKEFPNEFNSWNSDTFWKNAEEAELLIRPFCEASFILQCDGRTMADVFLIFLNLYNHISLYAEDTSYGDDIKKVIESRWLCEEQHLFMLAFALHPKYRLFMVEMIKKSEFIFGLWGDSKNVFTVARLTMAAKFYYSKHRVWMQELPTIEAKNRVVEDEQYRQRELKHHCRLLGIDIKKWLLGLTFDDGLTEDDYTGGHPVEFWQEQRREHTNLARFAQWIFSASIQSATCERLFKDFSQFHTKKRNKMSHALVHKQALVRRHLRRTRKMQNNQRDHKEKSKNRFVNPQERPKKSFGAPHEAQDEEKSSSSIETTQEEQDSDDDGKVVYGNDVLNEWMQALLATAPDDAFEEEDFEEDSTTDSDYASETRTKEVDYLVQHLAPECCCEEQWEEPAQLPTENVPNFPQENKNYFQTKNEVNYVRTDRISLEHLVVKLASAIDKNCIPSMRSVYQDEVQVAREDW